MRRPALLLLVALAFDARADAQDVGPIAASVRADPNAETTEIGVRTNEFRVRLGLPLPLLRGPRWNVTLAGAVELHDPYENGFPSSFWRGFGRVSVERHGTDWRAGLHVFHESDHETVRSVGASVRERDVFLFLNALGAHASRRWRWSKRFVDLGGAARFHVFTCTTLRRVALAPDDACASTRWRDGLGGELQGDLTFGGVLSEHTSLFAALFGSALAGARSVGTELRLSARAGAAFTTEVGTWTAYLDVLAGNEIGLERERRTLAAGAGLRYTPAFAD